MPSSLHAGAPRAIPRAFGRRFAFATRCVLVLVLGIASSNARAQETCADAVTQGDLNACMELSWRDADADLNEAYAAAMVVMRRADTVAMDGQDAASAQLRAAQRAWIPFRDAACASEGFLMRGGSAEPMLVYACLARLTTARTDDLRILSEAP